LLRPNYAPTYSLPKTPAPPYYAVIFSSLRTDGDRGYRHIAERVVALASGMPGFLAVESVLLRQIIWTMLAGTFLLRAKGKATAIYQT